MSIISEIYSCIFFLIYKHVNIMSNMYILNDIKNRGYRLGSAYEQKLKKKLRSITEFNFEINDFSEKVIDKYNEREEEIQ